MTNIILRMTHRIWNTTISRILCRAYSQGHINFYQLHVLASKFDQTQKHEVY